MMAYIQPGLDADVAWLLSCQSEPPNMAFSGQWPLGSSFFLVMSFPQSKSMGGSNPNLFRFKGEGIQATMLGRSKEFTVHLFSWLVLWTCWKGCLHPSKFEYTWPLQTPSFWSLCYCDVTCRLKRGSWVQTHRRTQSFRLSPEECQSVCQRLCELGKQICALFPHTMVTREGQWQCVK